MSECHSSCFFIDFSLFFRSIHDSQSFSASALSHRINVLLRWKLLAAVEMLEVIYRPRPIATLHPGRRQVSLIG